MWKSNTIVSSSMHRAVMMLQGVTHTKNRFNLIKVLRFPLIPAAQMSLHTESLIVKSLLNIATNLNYKYTHHTHVNLTVLLTCLERLIIFSL